MLLLLMLTTLFAIPVPPIAAEADGAIQSQIKQTKDAMKGLKHLLRIHNLFNQHRALLKSKIFKLVKQNQLLGEARKEAEQAYSNYFRLSQEITEYPAAPAIAQAQIKEGVTAIALQFKKDVTTEQKVQLKTLYKKYKEKLDTQKAKQKVVDDLENQIDRRTRSMMRDYKKVGVTGFLRKLFGPIAEKIAIPIAKKLGLGSVAAVGVSGVGLIGVAPKSTLAPIPNQPVSPTPTQNQPGSPTPTQNQPGSVSPSQNQPVYANPHSVPSSDANNLPLLGNLLGSSGKVEVNINHNYYNQV
jgi:hypothetical protein